MKSLCLFASYFESESIPYYMHVYLKELKRHFSEVYFLTSKQHLNEHDQKSLQNDAIQVMCLQNKGFDFGLWYQAIQRLDVSAYEQLALVNDSCILFKPLDAFMNWLQHDAADVKGMTRSEAVFPHVQSYFLVLNKKAIAPSLAYFNQYQLRETIHEVIHTYEVGMSRYWHEQGLSISSFVDNDGYAGEFSPYYFCVEAHLRKGIPLIKKKIIYASYRKDELFTLARMNFDIDPYTYIRLIKNLNAQLLISFEHVMKEQRPGLSLPARIRYGLTRRFIRYYKKMRHA